MTRRDRIQALLIRYLMSEGEIALKLPDGMILEVGVTKDSKRGMQQIEDYCWVQTTQNKRESFMDSYSQHLTCPQETVICDDDGSIDVF